MIEESLRRTLAGELEEPLPNRQSVREMERKLSRRQRLVRVWEFVLDDGRKPLVFELADGSLWQLSDVGLVRASFEQVGATWTEHPSVKPYLPADIVPRPKVGSPWNYEIALAGGAVLQVKPGRQERTFGWTVHLPKADH